MKSCFFLLTDCQGSHGGIFSLLPEGTEPFVWDVIHPSIHPGKPPHKAGEGLCLIPVSKPPIPLTLFFHHSSYLWPEITILIPHQTDHLKHLPGASPLLDGACDTRTLIFGDSFLKGVDKHWEGTPRKFQGKGNEQMCSRASQSSLSLSPPGPQSPCSPLR